MKRTRQVFATFLLATAAATFPTSSALAASKCTAGVWFTNGPENTLQQFLPVTPAGSGHYYLNCDLLLGDYNNFGVVALQNMLIKCYGQSIAADGDFGTRTRDALLNAQRIHGISQDGKYGWQIFSTVRWPTYAHNAPIDGGYYCRRYFDFTP